MSFVKKSSPVVVVERILNEIEKKRAGREKELLIGSCSNENDIASEGDVHGNVDDSPNSKSTLTILNFFIAQGYHVEVRKEIINNQIVFGTFVLWQ